MSFLRGNFITMADGSKKKIEDLAVGDIVKSGYGMNVFVRGVANLKHLQPWIGGEYYQKPVKINNEIICLKDQVFMGADGYFYVLEGASNDVMYPKYYNHNVYFVSENNQIFREPNFDIRDRTKPLEIGSMLLKDTGPVEVNSIEFLDPIIPIKNKDIWDEYYFSPDNAKIDGIKFEDFDEKMEDIIRHKIGGKGTYIVDGYICLSIQNRFWDYATNDKIAKENYEIVQVNGSLLTRVIK